MSFLRPLTLIFALLLVFASCKKKDDPLPMQPVTTVSPAPQPTMTPTPTGTSKPSEMVFRFTPVVKGVAVTKDSVYYSNTVGDLFTVTKFNYYVSHVRLVREDDSVFVEPESYH